MVLPNDALKITGTSHKNLKQFGQQIRDNRVAQRRAPDDNRNPYDIADLRKASIHFPYPAPPQREKRKDNPSSPATGSSQDHNNAARTSKGKGKSDRGDNTPHDRSKGKGTGAVAPWRCELYYDKVRIDEQTKQTKMDVSTCVEPLSFQHRDRGDESGNSQSAIRS